MKMEPIVSSETSAIRTQTPGNYPKRNKLQALTDLEVSRISRGLQLDAQYTRFFYRNAFVGLRDAP